MLIKLILNFVAVPVLRVLINSSLIWDSEM